MNYSSLFFIDLVYFLFRSHFKNKFTTLHDVRVRDRELVVWLSVKGYRLYIYILCAVIMCNNLEISTFDSMDYGFRTQRRSKHKLSRCRMDRIETESSEYIPCRHLSTVLITDQAIWLCSIEFTAHLTHLLCRAQPLLKAALLRQAAETLEFNPTEEELEAAVDAHMANMEAQMSRQGLNLEMYCSFLNTTVEQLRTDCRGEAAANLRAQATVDKIVQLENLKATPEEMGEALVLVCRQNNMTMEQLKPYVDAEFEKAIETNVLTGKVLRLIRDAATVTVGVDNEQK